ncbi:RnfABCDGE type electron transport complex subunit C [Allohahella marinimesophila]|uniref:Ion-translocating oxidoreductase complex subunit C n=1 Tax=Allohahella marinimesophila TaxID=1054972 RepID=A0ABP7P4A7_9GAMM
MPTDELIFPMTQRPGARLSPQVQAGEVVSQGQVIALAETSISGLVDPAGGPSPAATLHSPVAGKVTAFREHGVLLGGELVQLSCLFIRPTIESGRTIDLVTAIAASTSAQRQAAVKRVSTALPERMNALSTTAGRQAAFDAIAQDSGITGLGGGGFPLHAKLTASVNRVVINAAECEPFADADNALMQSAPCEVIAGAWLACTLLGLNEISLAIKSTLSTAQQQLGMAEGALRSMLGGQLELPRLKMLEIPAEYPAGAEQQVIKRAFGIEVPAGQRASQAGVACINVSTLAALGRFILWGESLTRRIVTVAGRAVSRPGNYEVPIGLAADVLLEAAGVEHDRLAGLVHGGGMMGTPLATAQLPLGKSSYCLIAADGQDSGLAVEHAIRQRKGLAVDTSPCIRCGFCEPVCPVGLLPQQLHFAAIAKDSDWLQSHHLSACIECGACEAVCPSQLPLVAEYREAKTSETLNRLARQKSEYARLRFEQRTERLRIEALERDARRAARKAALGSRNPRA